MLDLFEYYVSIDGEIDGFVWSDITKTAYLFGGSWQILGYNSCLEALEGIKRNSKILRRLKNEQDTAERKKA